MAIKLQWGFVVWQGQTREAVMPALYDHNFRNMEYAAMLHTIPLPPRGERPVRSAWRFVQYAMKWQTLDGVWLELLSLLYNPPRGRP